MELNDVKALIEEQGKTFEAFKSTLEQIDEETKKLGSADTVLQEKLVKIEAAFDKTEKASAELLKKQEEERAKAEKLINDANERVDHLETVIKRTPRSETEEERKAEIKKRRNLWANGVLFSYTKGEQNLPEDMKKVLEEIKTEQKALAVTNDTTGGYLAPHEYVQEILKEIVEVSPFRSVARIRQTMNRQLDIPKRTQTAAAGWVGENEPRTESQNPAFGMESIPTHEMYCMIDVSEQNLEDSAFDLEAFMREEATEQFSVLEGTGFILGNAVHKPEGILTNSDVGENNSGSSATIADANGVADGLMDLYHALKTPYARNATWLLNRVTLGSVRKLKDQNNNYIWEPGLAGLRPNTILSQPYIEMPDMPDEAANAYPIAFGDFRRAYIVVDRVAMSMLRDPYTQSTSGNIRFLFRRRVGGQVVLAEAFRKLKCST